MQNQANNVQFIFYKFAGTQKFNEYILEYKWRNLFCPQTEKRAVEGQKDGNNNSLPL